MTIALALALSLLGGEPPTGGREAASAAAPTAPIPDQAKRMTLDDLKQRLSDAGLGPMDGRGPYVFEIGPTLLAIRGYRIQVKDGRFRVGQTERGEWTSVDLETVDDNEACRFFLDQIMGEWLHFRTFTRSEDVQAVTTVLEANGVKVWRNDVPAPVFPEDRLRIFVRGEDIARAQRAAPAGRHPSEEPPRRL